MTEETKKNTSPEEKAEIPGDPSAEKSGTQEELAQLREKLELKEKEAKEHYDGYLRQIAEVNNYKKRVNRDKDDAIRYANEQLIKDLLPVVDNLERAVDHAKGGGNGKPLVEGVEMVLKGLLDVLGKYGVVQVGAVGEMFDPVRHEAMAQIESHEHKPNTVVDEHHKGYLLRERLLRPALVTVAKAPSKEQKNGENEVEKSPSDD